MRTIVLSDVLDGERCHCLQGRFREIATAKQNTFCCGNDILTLLVTLDLLQINTLIAKQRWFAILYYHVLSLLQARLEMSANGNS